MSKSTLADRISEIIDFKTKGKKKEFAEMMDWSASYVTKIMSGISIGLIPVMEILNRFPEINANWLIKGQGQMISLDMEYEIRNQAFEKAISLIQVQMFVSVMTGKELNVFINSLKTGIFPFGSEVITDWENRLLEKNKLQSELRELIERTIYKNQKL